MSKTTDIIDLFSEKMFSGNLKKETFLNRGELKIPFTCKYKFKCEVDEYLQPIWTAAIGSDKKGNDNFDIMAIGEAPSATEKVGVHMGGRFDSWKDNSESPVVPFREWVKSHNFEGIGYVTPYLTDLAKCGVSKQKEKSVLNIRIPICVKHILEQEIKLIKPRVILCIGNVPFRYVSDLIKESYPKTALFKLTHYGRQANLPLSIEDKMKIIWEWDISESDPRKREEIRKKTLSILSHFRD